MRKIIDISLMLEVGHRMHTPIGTKDVQFQLEVIKERDAPGGAMPPNTWSKMASKFTNSL
jgi:hypothetical protein